MKKTGSALRFGVETGRGNRRATPAQDYCRFLPGSGPSEVPDEPTCADPRGFQDVPALLVRSLDRGSEVVVDHDSSREVDIMAALG